jgi:hypothetical protein
MKSGKRVEIGEEVEMVNMIEANGMVMRGLLVPCDLPPVGVYICIRPFSLPGSVEKYEAKVMDLVSLKAEDALRLMLQGAVIPKDEDRWRPNNRRLRTKLGKIHPPTGGG